MGNDHVRTWLQEPDAEEFEVESESIEALRQLGLPITFGGSKYNRNVRSPSRRP